MSLLFLCPSPGVIEEIFITDHRKSQKRATRNCLASPHDSRLHPQYPNCCLQTAGWPACSQKPAALGNPVSLHKLFSSLAIPVHSLQSHKNFLSYTLNLWLIALITIDSVNILFLFFLQLPSTYLSTVIMSFLSLSTPDLNKLSLLIFHHRPHFLELW